VSAAVTTSPPDGCDADTASRRALPPASRRPPPLRPFEGRLGKNRLDVDVPGRAQRGDVDRKAGFEQCLVAVDRRENLLDERPARVEPVLHASVTFVGAVAETQRPLRRVVAVVGDLFDGLGSDGRDRGIGGRCQRAVQLELVGGEQQLAHDGSAEVAVGRLAQLQVRELALVAQEGKVVLGSSRAFDLSRVREQGARLPEQVECDVRERDVFFDLRSGRCPLPEPLREHEGVVTEPQCVGRGCCGCERRWFCRAHRCSTSAGTS
jgi:hypothetical protein